MPDEPQDCYRSSEDVEAEFPPVDVPADIMEKWQDIVDTMAQLIGVPSGLIMRLCHRDIEVYVSSRTEGNPYRPGDREAFFDSGLYCETVVRANDRLLVPNALVDENWSNNPDVELNMISYMGFPIHLPDGRPFGTICVLDSNPNAYTPTYEQLMLGFKELVENHLARIVMNRTGDDAERASERRFRVLFEHAPDAFFLCDLEGRVVDCNRAHEAITGYKRNDVVGKTIAELDMVSDRQYPAVTRTLALSTLGSSAGPTALDICRKDGSIASVEVRTLPLEIDNRVYVLGIARDVTERRESQKALQESEERYREAIEHAPYGIFRSHVAGQFLEVNPALVDMLGYESDEELLQIDLGQDLYMDPAVREQLVGVLRDSSTATGLEVRWRRKDGTPIDVRVSARLVQDETGDSSVAEGIVEDFTERKVLEDQLRQAQKMEAVGQLTGGIAHDFNNLLSVIQLNTEIARAAAETGAAVDVGDLTDIEAAARKASEMTKQLLGFSRQAELTIAPTDLAEVVQRLSSMLRRVLPEDIDIRISADDSFNLANADTCAVEQMLLNLATNARDAMPQGGELLIEVGEQDLDTAYQKIRPWVKMGKYVCVSVTDSGIGIDEEKVPHVFEPFFTTKEVGEGTGLGLAMVYGLMKQHCGYVHLYSEENVGTTVRLYFPKINGKTESKLAGSKEDLPRGTETILVVEDEEKLRRATGRVLEKHGYDVLAAEDGENALQIYRNSSDRIDLILSDTVMPKMGGPELYHAIEQEPDMPSFVLASGYSGCEMKARNGLTEVVPFVQKPWTVSQLLVCVRDALDNAAAPSHIAA